MKRCLIALALATGATLAPLHRAAMADESSAAKAEALFNEGIALASKYRSSADIHDLEEASRKFVAAYRLHPTPTVLFNVALTEEKLEHPADAIHHFRQILRDPAGDIQLAAQASKHVSELASKVATVGVEAPAGADILVDGASVGEKAPLADPIDLVPGKHTLEARGGGSASIQIDAGAGTRQTVRMDFASPSTASIPLPAAASAQPSPSAASSAPSSPSPSNAATDPLARADVTESRPSFWSTRRKVGLAVAGAGVASLVVGGIFEAQSSSDKSQADSIGAMLGSSACSGANPPGACGQLSDAYSAQDRDQTLGRVFLGVGAVGVLAGAALFFWPDHARAAHTAIVPFTLPHGGGLQLQGDM